MFLKRRNLLKTIGGLAGASALGLPIMFFSSKAKAINPTGSGRFVPFGPAGSPFPFCRFFPFNGNTITINGVQYQIPGPGIDFIHNNATIDGIPNQVLSPFTLYYAYIYASGGVLKPEFSQTGWRTDDSPLSGNGDGIAIKGNDKTRVVVGMVRTNQDGKFVGDDKNQLTSSFFNRVRIGLRCSMQDCFTSSPVWMEPNSNNRISFVCWQDDIPEVSLSGVMTNDTLFGHNEVGILIDGVLGSSIAVWDCLSPNSSSPFSVKNPSDGGTLEGYHYFGVGMKVLGGTGALRAGNGGFTGTTQLSASPVPS